jgi:hypothetical protein
MPGDGGAEVGENTCQSTATGRQDGSENIATTHLASHDIPTLRSTAVNGTARPAHFARRRQPLQALDSLGRPVVEAKRLQG